MCQKCSPSAKANSNAPQTPSAHITHTRILRQMDAMRLPPHTDDQALSKVPICVGGGTTKTRSAPSGRPAWSTSLGDGCQVDNCRVGASLLDSPIVHTSTPIVRCFRPTIPL